MERPECEPPRSQPGAGPFLRFYVFVCLVSTLTLGWLIVGDHISTATFVVVALVAFVLLIPPRFDPAIRLKEWLERNRRR